MEQIFFAVATHPPPAYLALPRTGARHGGALARDHGVKAARAPASAPAARQDLKTA
tara:strand:+ start:117 stop:284 length:168 start_codon:yes stop_codon:yes gene_type:complete